MFSSDEENGLSCIIHTAKYVLKVNADISKRISMRVLKLAQHSSVLVSLEDFGLPFGIERHESSGEAADLDDKILMAFRMHLRVQ